VAVRHAKHGGRTEGLELDGETEQWTDDQQVRAVCPDELDEHVRRGERRLDRTQPAVQRPGSSIVAEHAAKPDRHLATPPVPQLWRVRIAGIQEPHVVAAGPHVPAEHRPAVGPDLGAAPRRQVVVLGDELVERL
jgi:hypothetical protein